jgi:hypothetical protein
MPRLKNHSNGGHDPDQSRKKVPQEPLTRSPIQSRSRDTWMSADEEGI